MRTRFALSGARRKKMPWVAIDSGGLITRTTSGTFTLTAANAKTNDVAIAVVWTNGINTFSVPTGWTNIYNIEGSSTRLSAALFWRRATADGNIIGAFGIASGDALSGTNAMYGRIIAVRDCIETGNPYNTYSASSDVASSTNGATIYGHQAINPTVKNSLILSWFITEGLLTFASGGFVAGGTGQQSMPSGFFIGRYATSSTVGADTVAAPIARTRFATGAISAGAIGTANAPPARRTLALALTPAA